MATTTTVRHELVCANRILGHEGVLDAYGHVSARHPERADRFLLSRARSPAMVEDEDLLEFDLDGEPVDRGGPIPYIERYIHAAAYAARPDVNAVCHNHALSVVAFSISSVELRAVIHTASFLGVAVPVWDLADDFPDETSLLVRNLEQGTSLATRLSSGAVALMRGHGSVVVGRDVQEVVSRCINLERNAHVQAAAAALGSYTPLRAQECAPGEPRSSGGDNRAWEYFCERAGVEVEG